MQCFWSSKHEANQNHREMRSFLASPVACVRLWLPQRLLWLPRGPCWLPWGLLWLPRKPLGAWAKAGSDPGTGAGARVSRALLSSSEFFVAPQSFSELLKTGVGAGAGAPQSSPELFRAPQSPSELRRASQSSSKLFRAPQNCSELPRALQSISKLFETLQSSSELVLVLVLVLVMVLALVLVACQPSECPLKALRARWGHR